jgi:uncharacterized repeat protein (TIGR03803 family)
MLWQKNFMTTYLLAVALCVCAAASTSAAQTVTVIYSLTGNSSYSGTSPYAALVQGLDGSLYGTTSSGGEYGFGTVFAITTAGTLTTIYNFPQAETPNGLLQAVNGNFYGTTQSGGTGTYGNGGTVFEITTGGTLTTIHNFCSVANCADGSEPIGNLVQAANGDIYGTTYAGGTGGAGGGTLFQITPAGAFTTVASLGRAGLPESLVLATSGDLYFTGNGGYLYQFSPATGKLETVTRGSTGFTSANTLIQASNGDLYGVSTWGATPNTGILFELTPEGAATVIFSTLGNVYGAMVEATDGNIYGLSYNWSGYLCGPDMASSSGCGSIFSATPAGSVNPGLYKFCTQNIEPDCPAYGPIGLIQATDGNLYGVTRGGDNLTVGGSTVFKLSVGLGPFVETLQLSGKVGASVYILGTGLTGTTAVSFNGTPATSFTVNSTGSAIKAVIPTGATTGTIQVTTLGGTLSSNAPFQIP